MVQEEAPTRFQVVIDAHQPARELAFWVAALRYVPEPPPAGFDSWGAYYKRLGLPKEDQSDVADSIVDPTGAGPRIWFQQVDEVKNCKNRLHFDLRVSGGFGVPMTERRLRVESEVARLVGLGATRVDTYEQEGVEHYAVAMLDPEGNEFDVN